VAAARPLQLLQSAAVEYDDGAGVLTPKSRKQAEARRLSEGQWQVAAPVVAHMAKPGWSTADELELDDELDDMPPAAPAAAPPPVASPFKARLAVRFGGAPEAIPFGAPVGAPFGVPALASGLRAPSSVSVASPAASRLLPPLEWADAHASGPRSLLTRTPAAHTSEPRSLLARTPAKGAAAKGQRPPAVVPASSSSGAPGGADGSALPHFARRSSLRPATLESFTAAKEAEGAAKKAEEDAAVAAADVTVARPAMAEANVMAAAEAEKAAEKATTEKAAAEKAAAEKAAAEKASAEKPPPAPASAVKATKAAVSASVGPAEADAVGRTEAKAPAQRPPPGALPSALLEAARACGLESILLGLPPPPPHSRRAAAAAAEADKENVADQDTNVDAAVPAALAAAAPTLTQGAKSPTVSQKAAADADGSLLSAAAGIAPRWQKLDMTMRPPTLMTAPRGTKRPEGSDGSESHARRAITTEQKKRRRAESLEGPEAEVLSPHAASAASAASAAAAFDLFAD
jgi:hypothetical protein